MYPSYRTIALHRARVLILSATAGPDDDDPIFAAITSSEATSQPREDTQTFVFSATLSKDLQQNLKRRQRKPKAGVKRASALGQLGVGHF